MIFSKKQSFLLSAIILITLSIPAVIAQPADAAEPKVWKQLNRNLAAAIAASDRRFNSSIIDAMIDIPRHRFLTPAYTEIAYENISLPAYDKALLPSVSDTIRAIEMLSPSSTDTLLIAGNNAGYAAAILSKLVKDVYLIEETSAAEEYESLYTELNITNITLSDTVEINSFDEIFAFNKIFIHGAVNAVSENITERLAIQGNITCILAEPSGFQQIISIRRSLLGDNISCGGSCYFPEIRKLKISN